MSDPTPSQTPKSTSGAAHAEEKPDPTSQVDQPTPVVRIISQPIIAESSSSVDLPPPEATPSEVKPTQDDVPVVDTSDTAAETKTVAAKRKVLRKPKFTIRRAFGLVTMFDFFLTFIVWVIYGYKRFDKEMKEYSFLTSLFDIVMLSVWRCAILETVYIQYNFPHWGVVVFTTLGSCCVFIGKIVVYKWDLENPVSYVLIVTSFLLTVLETWFLIFKVLPADNKSEEQMAHSDKEDDLQSCSTATSDKGDPIPTRTRSIFASLPNILTPNSDRRESRKSWRPSFFPIPTIPGLPRRGSDDSRRSQYGGIHLLRRGTTHQEYIRQANQSWDVVWTYITSPESEWKKEAGTDDVDGVVHVKTVKGVGKVRRLTSVIDIPPKLLFDDLNNNPMHQPKWNKTIKESKIIATIDHQTDVLYTIAAERAMITSRDFVSLRTWGEKNGYLIACAMGVKHADMPPQKAYIRGTNGAGGFVFRPVPGNPNKCLLNWYSNTDLGGWLPQRVIDANMSGVMLDFNKELRAHAETLKKGH